jgi:hypothetical protein
MYSHFSWLIFLITNFWTFCKSFNPLCCSGRRTQRDVDPDFGITIVKPEKRNDYYALQQQQWKPYSPYYIGLPGFSKPYQQSN